MKKKKMKDLMLTDFSKIRTQIVSFKGTDRLDIRRFVDTNMSTQDPKWIPTKAGISIPTEIWPEFIIYMKKIVRKVKEELEK